MRRVVSFEQSPPLAAPLRFFLIAPLYAMASAVLLLWQGPDAFASRWTPAALALTHLMTLGFLSLSMIGALLQILPVVAGVEVWRPVLTGRAVHLLLAAGAAVLPAAFLTMEPLLFQLAVVLLASGFSWLLAACWPGLWHVVAPSATLKSIRLALLALLVTVGLGLTLAGAFAWSANLPLMQLTDLHAGWGLGGWVGLLVIGVAYQVVPMFQLTPIYPPRVTRWLAGLLFLLLVAWTIGTTTASAPAWAQALPGVLAAAGYAAFAILTISLLWRRKRPTAEPTTLFWYLGLASLLAGAALWAAGSWLPGNAGHSSFAITVGVLLIVGFASSTINGMLYKIVPFLVWYHLQTRLVAGPVKAPNVRQVIAPGATRGQFASHALALLLLLAATIWPAQLARLAAAAFLLSSGWLWVNLLSAFLLYRRRISAVALAS